MPGSGQPGEQPSPFTSIETARVYCVDPRFWESEPNPERDRLCDVPEREMLRHKADVGVALSGGGTRSAAASLGALRALHRNGWLDRVKYVSAVSGGGWAALPFAYSTRSNEDVLGTTAECRVVRVLDGKREIRCGELGVLGEAIAASSVLRCGLEYVFGNTRTGRYILPVMKAFGASCARSGSTSATFAAIMGKIFLNGDLCNDCGEQVLGKSAFPAEDRPFLILGGTVVAPGATRSRPRLRPLEITPAYTGIRQRFGHLGGAYVESWAYGRRPIGLDGDRVVIPAGRSEGLTLQDALAITGSAPYLQVLMAENALNRAAGFFPVVGHWSAQDGDGMPFERGLPHADGGFTDNIGVMPLLARGVKNILVFVNAAGPVEDNGALRSLFMPIAGLGSDGDRSRNVVFERAGYETLVRRLNKASHVGPAVACFRGWQVLGNAFYNIRASHDGVNICWVYSHKDVPWLSAQHEAVRQHVAGNGGEFEHFPWYRTFGEQAPRVIDLTTSQVALLAAIVDWSVTQSRGLLSEYLGLNQAAPQRPAPSEVASSPSGDGPARGNTASRTVAGP
jgi:hypothetical protein